MDFSFDFTTGRDYTRLPVSALGTSAETVKIKKKKRSREERERERVRE